jgi:hypothetical protein
MTVRVKRIDGNVETFETQEYLISKKKDMHPAILDVRVYAGSRCIVHRRRWFQWFYKKFLYKPVQTELKPADETPQAQA